MKLHRMLTTAAPALALVLLLPQAASAALLDSGTFTDSYGPQISYCGEPFEQAGVSTGRYQVVSEGLDGLPHMLVQARDADTWTNTITGGRVSVESQYMGRDIAARPLYFLQHATDVRVLDSPGE